MSKVWSFFTQSSRSSKKSRSPNNSTRRVSPKKLSDSQISCFNTLVGEDWQSYGKQHIFEVPIVKIFELSDQCVSNLFGDPLSDVMSRTRVIYEKPIEAQVESGTQESFSSKFELRRNPLTQKRKRDSPNSGAKKKTGDTVDRYEIKLNTFIGKGLVKSCYRAEINGVKCIMLFKKFNFMQRHLTKDLFEDIMRRQRTVAALRYTSHPFLYDFFEHSVDTHRKESAYFIATEEIKGDTLTKRLKRPDGLNIPVIMTKLLEMYIVLACKYNIIQPDPNLDNFIVTSYDSFKVIDDFSDVTSRIDSDTPLSRLKYALTTLSKLCRVEHVAFADLRAYCGFLLGKIDVRKSEIAYPESVPVIYKEWNELVHGLLESLYKYANGETAKSTAPLSLGKRLSK